MAGRINTFQFAQATNFMLQQSAILKVSQTFAQQNIGGGYFASLMSAYNTNY